MSSISPPGLTVDEKQWKVFRRKIRTQTKEENWADPRFVRLAEDLYSFYRSANAQELKTASSILKPYLELVRQDWGLGAVQKTVGDLLARGAVPKTLAASAQFSARAGKDHELAVAMLESIYDVHYTEPTVSLALGQAYAAVGRWGDLDRLAKTTLSAGAVREWTADRWARLLVDNCRFLIAPEFIALLDQESVKRKLLETRVESFSSSAQRFGLPTYLVNLDREPRKLQLSMELLSHGGYTPHRIAAVDGSELPSFAHVRLGASPEVYAEQGAGAVATALSHIGIWERFLASTADHCLVVEDDASPYVHWTYHEENLEKAKKFDLVWGNERMSAVLEPSVLPSEPVANPWDILAGRPPAFNGIGADCYLLSRSGAEKLLEFYSQHSIRGHIDGQMGAYSIGPTDEKPVTKTQSVTQNLRDSMGVVDGLSSVCLTIPAIMANDHGVSNTTEISREQRVNAGG